MDNIKVIVIDQIQNKHLLTNFFTKNCDIAAQKDNANPSKQRIYALNQHQYGKASIKH